MILYAPWHNNSKEFLNGSTNEAMKAGDLYHSSSRTKGLIEQRRDKSTIIRCSPQLVMPFTSVISLVICPSYLLEQFLPLYFIDVKHISPNSFNRIMHQNTSQKLSLKSTPLTENFSKALFDLIYYILPMQYFIDAMIYISMLSLKFEIIALLFYRFFKQ